MRRSCRCGLFKRRPAGLVLTATHARAIRETTKTDVQLLGAEACGSNFGEILQLEEHFAVGAFAITVNHRLAFFVVLSQRPRRDCLDVTSSKTRAAIGIEHVATAGFIKHGPNLESFAEFPATTVQHSAAPAELRSFTLIPRSFCEIVECLFARNF